MTIRLKGKTALITAAAAGIGRATARAFAAEGAKVHATDIDMKGLETLRAEDPRIEIARFDVCDAAACAGAPAIWPDINVLVNMAGTVHNGTILDCAEADWSRSFDLNVSAMYRTIRAFLPRFIAQGGGSIINMASVASSIKGAPNRFAYGATKAAVIGMTKSIAVDFAKAGIRCNAICPGTVDTPSLRGRIAAAPDETAARAAFIARQPMGRFGEPAEIAALAVYLASDESAFTSGAVHIIDGAWSA